MQRVPHKKPNLILSQIILPAGKDAARNELSYSLFTCYSLRVTR